jgi:hypothetical protein
MKGLRILLHPSVLEFLKEQKPSSKESEVKGFRILKCPDDECLNEIKVTHELNYWNLKPTREKETWKKFQKMWEKAPQSIEMHYQATAEAINRMRVNYGEPPMVDLKRKSLPKKKNDNPKAPKSGSTPG